MTKEAGEPDSFIFIFYKEEERLEEVPPQWNLSLATEPGPRLPERGVQFISQDSFWRLQQDTQLDGKRMGGFYWHSASRKPGHASRAHHPASVTAVPGKHRPADVRCMPGGSRSEDRHKQSIRVQFRGITDATKSCPENLSEAPLLERCPVFVEPASSMVPREEVFRVGGVEVHDSLRVGAARGREWVLMAHGQPLESFSVYSFLCFYIGTTTKTLFLKGSLLM